MNLECMLMRGATSAGSVGNQVAATCLILSMGSLRCVSLQPDTTIQPNIPLDQIQVDVTSRYENTTIRLTSSSRSFVHNILIFPI